MLLTMPQLADGTCQTDGCTSEATWAHTFAPKYPVYCSRECRREDVRARRRLGLVPDRPPARPAVMPLAA